MRWIQLDHEGLPLEQWMSEGETAYFIAKFRRMGVREDRYRLNGPSGTIGEHYLTVEEAMAAAEALAAGR